MTPDEAARRVLPLIDLTLLGDHDTMEEVEALCDAATTAHGDVAAVCVWPRFVSTAVNRLGASGIPVAGVANFPTGSVDNDVAIADAMAVVGAGGAEVDVVFPWRALLDGQTGVGAELVRQVREAMPESALLKVILETGEIEDPEYIHIAAREAIDGGADFLKTSTGKTERSATPKAARQLFEIAREADRPIGIKISGGVRTVEDAAEYLSIADEVLGPDHVDSSTMRVGASSLLAAVVHVLEET